MDYYGLFPKFKFNRPINSDERKNELKKDQKIDLSDQSMVPDIKVISMSSHCLELVDKYYSAKGFLALLGLFGFFIFLFSSLFLTYVIIFWYG